MRELIDAIERVRERIKKYGDKLNKNEMLTRYVLVDPILRALGWDTENPDQVVPEPITETGRPDYALIHNGEKLIMVEVKSLKSDLKKAREDGFKYCWKNKVPFYIITDGDDWELHDLREMGGKEIFRVRLSTDSPGDIARHLLAIWYPAMPELKPAPKSVLDIYPTTQNTNLYQPPKNYYH
ncbi:MAG: type I restriction endonuclease [Candidatus Calescibacterium sp.]